jgi:hypothetical protein
MRVEHAKKVLDDWYTSNGSGQLRFAKTVDGYLRAGEEIVHKLNELDAETQAALVLLGKTFSSPKFEVVCVGPELTVDRVYVYKRKA